MSSHCEGPTPLRTVEQKIIVLDLSCQFSLASRLRTMVSYDVVLHSTDPPHPVGFDRFRWKRRKDARRRLDHGSRLGTLFGAFTVDSN